MMSVIESCMVTFFYEGRERRANVRTVPGSPEQVFHVTLEDGYENIFFIPESSPYSWYEKNIGFTGLASSVGAAIEKVFF